MPCEGSSSPWNVNPRLWQSCLNQSKKAMLAEGWNKHANKFDEVRLRRALKLWNK